MVSDIRCRSATSTPPPAVVSVDLDSTSTHLAGYGLAPRRPDDMLEVAVARLLAAFERHRVRATFFVVAMDRSSAATDAILECVKRGHELASHSMTHPMPFSRLPLSQLRIELRSSREILEEEFGIGVTGFRSPNWDTGHRVFRALHAAGYAYDASVLPTLLQVPLRAILAAKARRLSPIVAMPLWPASLNRGPYRMGFGADGALWEFPVSVTTSLRLPLYHTFRYRMSDRTFARHLDGFVRRSEPFTYPMHAIDAAGRGDHLDPRLARHPGMDLSTSRKLELVESTVAAIASRFRVITYSQLRRELEDAAASE
jgi:hypothetical protein